MIDSVFPNENFDYYPFLMLTQRSTIDRPISPSPDLLRNLIFGIFFRKNANFFIVMRIFYKTNGPLLEAKWFKVIFWFKRIFVRMMMTIFRFCSGQSIEMNDEFRNFSSQSWVRSQVHLALSGVSVLELFVPRSVTDKLWQLHNGLSSDYLGVRMVLL